MIEQENQTAAEDERALDGLLLMIVSLIAAPLAVGFTIVSEVGGLVGLLVAAIAFFVGLGLMGVFKDLREFLCF